jgi:hypothetical protein
MVGESYAPGWALPVSQPSREAVDRNYCGRGPWFVLAILRNIGVLLSSSNGRSIPPTVGGGRTAKSGFNTARG